MLVKYTDQSADVNPERLSHKVCLNGRPTCPSCLFRGSACPATMASRVPDHARTSPAPAMAPKPGPQVPASPDQIEAGLLALQREVGNRAIAGIMARRVVQRHEDISTNAQVGEPEVQPGTATETAPPTTATTEPGGGPG